MKNLREEIDQTINDLKVKICEIENPKARLKLIALTCINLLKILSQNSNLWKTLSEIISKSRELILANYFAIAYSIYLDSTILNNINDFLADYFSRCLLIFIDKLRSLIDQYNLC